MSEEKAEGVLIEGIIIGDGYGGSGEVFELAIGPQFDCATLARSHSSFI